MNTDNNTTQWTDLENDHNSSLSLKPSSNLELLVNQFNNANANPEKSNDTEKVFSSKFYDIEEMHHIEIPQVSLLNNLNLSNYSFEFTPTETSPDGTLLYIANHLSYKCCNNLNIYKKMNWNLLLGHSHVTYVIVRRIFLRENNLKI